MLADFGRLPAGTNGMPHADEAMTTLLVFPREDSQSLCFLKAAERLCLQMEAAQSAEAAMDRYISARHDVVVVDRRAGSGGFDADSLLQSMRAVSQSELTTFVAVTRAGASRYNRPLTELISVGYDLKFAENISVDACCDALTSCQHNCFRWQQRMASLPAVFAALDRVQDAVEIADDSFHVQYVNSAYERMFGFSLTEVVGRHSFDVLRADNQKEEVAAATSSLRKGKEWHGSVGGRAKSGSLAPHFNSVLPVKGRRGNVQHFVSVRQQSRAQLSHRDSGAKEAGALSTLRSARRDGDHVRPSSVTIEAPIHKVISLITEAQEHSSAQVVTALDQVLAILHRTTDLYSGELQAAETDKMTSDYVGGLMSGASRQPEKKRTQPQTRRSHLHRPSEILTEHITMLLANSASNMQSLSEIPAELLAFLEGDDEWSFDILELERVTQKRPMVYLAMKTLQRFNVCQFLQCSEDTMLKWLQVMQDHYHADNCYHNATHGADVMQCSAFFLERDRIKSVFDEMDEVASLLGALVHDLDHPGRTNPFLINSQHRLSLLYNDMSVLESHHVSLAFQLSTKDERINIFKNLSRDDYKTLRHSIIDIVLATEMAKHFEHVGKFSNQIVAPLIAKEGEDGAERITEEESLEMLTKSENRTLIKRVLIKCSDISNQCRPLKICKEWSRRISEEYFQQTDDEKAKNLPIVMPVFDRATCNLPQSQTSFIDFFLREMFSAWHAFCDVPELLENMNNNYAYWKQLAEEAKRAEEAMREVDEDSGDSGG